MSNYFFNKPLKKTSKLDEIIVLLGLEKTETDYAYTGWSGTPFERENARLTIRYQPTHTYPLMIQMDAPYDHSHSEGRNILRTFIDTFHPTQITNRSGVPYNMKVFE